MTESAHTRFVCASFITDITRNYNSRPSKLVCTSVTLASVIQPRAVVCVSYIYTAILSHDSVCIHSATRISPPKHRIRREVVLLFFIGYIFFYMTYHASHNISEYIIAYCSFMSRPLWLRKTKARSPSIDLLGIPDLYM